MSSSEGFQKRDVILKLEKNLCGLKDASKRWFNYLSQTLTDKHRNFRQSQVDPCVFYKEDCIVLVYVDDCLVLGKDKEVVAKLAKSLERSGFKFTRERNLTKYLGVNVTRESEGWHLTQPYLIERIIDAAGLIDCRPKDNPVRKPLLHKDLEGTPPVQQWHYRSVVGMLNYLTKTTRGDIAMATHQVSRFCENPRQSHEQAIRQIVKYLAGTKHEGVWLKPDTSKGIECYVGADFAGGFNKDVSTDPATVLSRTGYVILYVGCPIHWVSKLQPEIALSSTESEYVAFSTAVRDIVPLMNLCEEVKSFLPVKTKPPNFKCKIFVDNKSCIKMANAPIMTPRTKHIAIRYHHFRNLVAKKALEIEYCPTDDMVAGMLTKLLPDLLFRKHWRALLGW